MSLRSTTTITVRWMPFVSFISTPFARSWIFPPFRIICDSNFNRFWPTFLISKPPQTALHPNIQGTSVAATQSLRRVVTERDTRPENFYCAPPTFPSRRGEREVYGRDSDIWEWEEKKKNIPAKVRHRSVEKIGGKRRGKLGGAGGGRNIRGSEPRESVLCFCLFSLVSS